ncbi:MAG: hypothetical protein JWQ34_1167 [Mucilaginibacter sp.]|uniref:hypothetical protein n=1 Tax=Mucilaginibacter sp. TaxID=1882438 RepID=UPI0026270483|nr:hypothetical protein [Mucilaginibacter sp.]MDB5002942.1 hypothetical protein [Mucilaginibacter sp.]
MATVTYNVPPELITKLTDGQTAIGQFLLDVFAVNSTVNTELICAELVAFHDGDGGSPEVKQFDILPEEVIYDPETHKGKVTFRYRVRFFFGCSDINSDEPANEKADFEVDLINNILAVHIHDPIRRDTIDEF